MGLVTGVGMGLANVVRNQHLHTTDTALAAVGASTAGSLVGSMLPDILEPATSPNHRGLFHSLLFLGLLGGLLYWLWQRNGRPHVGLAFAMGLVGGCGSHLVADATTPHGLPLA